MFLQIELKTHEFQITPKTLVIDKNFEIRSFSVV